MRGEHIRARDGSPRARELVVAVTEAPLVALTPSLPLELAVSPVVVMSADAGKKRALLRAKRFPRPPLAP
jgi:hypothetical protein